MRQQGRYWRSAPCLSEQLGTGYAYMFYACLRAQRLPVADSLWVHRLTARACSPSSLAPPPMSRSQSMPYRSPGQPGAKDR